MSKLTVYFSCDTCGLKDCPCTLRYRRTDEDVLSYIEDFMSRIIDQVHRSKSPSCPARSIQNLKIPMPDAPPPRDGIGMSGSFKNGPPATPPSPENRL